jgi:deoxycytidylate deaminase
VNFPPFVTEAIAAAMLSPCQSKRGAVVFQGNRLIATGFNHKPRPFWCDGTDACKSNCAAEAIHAEQMALLCAGVGRAVGADLLHVKAVDRQLVKSGGPSCVQCSKLALGVEIAGVWLFHGGSDGWRRYPIEEFHRLSLAADRFRRRQIIMGTVLE